MALERTRAHWQRCMDSEGTPNTRRCLWLEPIGRIEATQYCRISKEAGIALPLRLDLDRTAIGVVLAASLQFFNEVMAFSKCRGG